MCTRGAKGAGNIRSHAVRLIRLGVTRSPSAHAGWNRPIVHPIFFQDKAIDDKCIKSGTDKLVATTEKNRLRVDIRLYYAFDKIVPRVNY